MKNWEIKQLYTGLIELSKDTDLKLNVKTSFIIAKNILVIKPIYELILQEEEKIWKKLGRTNPNGSITIPVDLVDQWKEETEELNNIENEVKLQQIGLNELENEKISIATMMKIMKIIKET